MDVGGCQNYGPFLGPWYNTVLVFADAKGDHNFDNHPCRMMYSRLISFPCFWLWEVFLVPVLDFSYSYGVDYGSLRWIYYFLDIYISIYVDPM